MILWIVAPLPVAYVFQMFVHISLAKPVVLRCFRYVSRSLPHDDAFLTPKSMFKPYSNYVVVSIGNGSIV